ncbi:hypothetical protein [Campylobacter concisus]|uniref:hypothetical protein n=1 Tax=Campylobacter concisus TaxID=199 RepID=UPI0015E1AFBA|nr:hypothetical protein [Campylobacter concisus]
MQNTRLAINQRSELKVSRQTQPKIEMAEIKPKTSNQRSRPAHRIKKKKQAKF